MKVALNGRTLTTGGVVETGASYLVPGQDAAGTIILRGRSEVGYEGVEKVDC